MRIYTMPKVALIMTMLVASTLQVNIVLRVSDTASDRSVLALCPQILPGRCCISRALNSQRFGAWDVQFYNLRALDIAAVWGDGGSATAVAPAYMDACYGTVLASRAGPGSWHWQPADINSGNGKGASYISLPTALPPTDEDANWLAAEGMLGLVWGNGKWFSSKLASAYFGSFQLTTRDIRSAKKGQVFARSPPGIVFPSIVRIGDVNYTAVDAGGVLYREDVTGAILNLTSEFSD